MQIDIVQIDPEWLGAPGSFVAKPAAVLMHTTMVAEAPSMARKYRNYRHEIAIVHIVTEAQSRGRLVCRCGLVSDSKWAFEVHERPWSFREFKYGNRVERPRFGPEKWHRLCSRCVS
jgi:hypothetical protein